MLNENSIKYFKVRLKFKGRFNLIKIKKLLKILGLLISKRKLDFKIFREMIGH